MNENSFPRRLKSLDDPGALERLERYRPVVDDWDAFIEALRRPLPSCIWANPIRTTPGALAELLDEEGVEVEPLAWKPGAFRLAEGLSAGGSWWYLAGLAHGQEEASMVPVTVLQPMPGERVLDLCAAPGGKSAQIAVAMGNQGSLVANDRAMDRLRALKGNLERLGIVNVSITRHDGNNYPRKVGQFDRILLDAPCSGEGTLRKNPKLIGRIGPDYSAAFARRQRMLLRKAVQRCRPGGRIVYSTCTFAPEENEAVVADILAEFAGQLRLLPARVEGLHCSGGLGEWQGRVFDPVLGNCLRLWPHHNDSGGFFVALLEKVGGVREEAHYGLLNLPEADHAYLEALKASFGIPDWVWEKYRFHRQAARGINLVALDHRPPLEPRPESVGIFCHKTQSKPPKLTTAAAMLLGPHAMRNRVYLDARQRDAYLKREVIELRAAQLVEAESGLVLVYYRGYALGLGLFRAQGMLLASLFPKRWSSRIKLE